MKTSRIVLFLAGAALMILPARSLMADDTTAPGSSTPSVTAGDKGARLEKLKAALAELDLTDDQKAKIKDIFTTVPKGRERRQQIIAVLTPEQKEKLRQMIQEHRDNTQAGGGTAAN